MSEDFKPLKNIALALCISIAEARNQSARKVHYVLRNFNDLLNLDILMNNNNWSPKTKRKLFKRFLRKTKK